MKRIQAYLKPRNCVDDTWRLVAEQRQIIFIAKDLGPVTAHHHKTRSSVVGSFSRTQAW